MHSIGRVVFKGSFGEFFCMSLGLIVLTICTFGILLPYFIYWQSKFFFEHLELEIFPSQGPTASLPPKLS